MVVSSGFLDHAAEAYLRTNGLIMSGQPMTTLNRGTDWSQQIQSQSQQQPPQTQQLPQQQLQQNQQSQQPLSGQQQLIIQQQQLLTVDPIAQGIKNGQQQPARAILICQPNSHPFQTRNILLEPRQEIKVGRSVPRSRVDDSNAIFDCKVLSRNHAIIWFSDGKFFIKDTGSSNGTFINSQRIKLTETYEISSGDIVQFGVDVTENTRKETHGCIIAQLKLITPEGIEKTSYQQQFNQSACNLDNDIYRLSQIMNESFQREQILETKLLNLQKVVETTRSNSSNSWQAMIHEDLLLSRIDILENKLQCYQKNATEEKLQDQVAKLQDEKNDYQKTAKEALKKVYQERMAIFQKYTQSEQIWQNVESELALLRSQLNASKENNEELTAKLVSLESEYNSLTEQCNQYAEKQESHNTIAENLYAQLAKQVLDCQFIKECLDAAQKENEELKNRLQLIENINASELINVSEGSDSDKNKIIGSVYNTKPAILNWLNHSSLNKLKECDDIINAIVNESKGKDDSELSSEKCTQLYDKLIEIEKKLFLSDNKIIDDSNVTKSDESISTTTTTTTNDGNQNSQSQQCDSIDLTTLRNIVIQLKEMYIEFLNQIKLIQKDLIRKSKYDELESKLNATKLELQILQEDLRNRQIQNVNSTHVNKEIRADLLATAAITTKNLTNDRNALNNRTTINNDKNNNNDNNINITNGNNTMNNLNTDSDNVNTIKNLNNMNNNGNLDNVDPQQFKENATERLNVAETNRSLSTNSINHLNNSDESSLSNLSKDESSFSTQIDQTERLEIIDKNENSETNATKLSEGTSSGSDDSVGDRSTAPAELDDSLGEEEKAALDTFDRILEEECKILGDTDLLLGDDDLVDFKERCVKLTDENKSLQKEIQDLRYSNSKQLTMILYIAPLAAFIGYLLSLLYFR